MVGKRNRSHVGAVPKLKSVYRNAAVIPVALNHTNRRASSVNEQGAEVAVSSFANA
jgi:hypothetical protein